MGRRKSPYLTKTKEAKNREHNKKSAVNGYKSEDIVYTTESSDKQTKYDYTNKYKNYKDYFTSDIYDSKLFDTYNPKRKGSGESYTFDDYTTSGISYKSHKKRPKDLVYSVSTSDYLLPSVEKYGNISSYRNYEHSYPTRSRSREKPRLKLDKAIYNDVLDESEQYVDRDRRYWSPRSRYYQELIHEKPEKDYNYDKYFEKTSVEFGGLRKQRRLDKYNDEKYEKQKKSLPRTPNKHREYQVYAYQEPKNHEEVFKRKDHLEDSLLSSEVEIKTHEYPVLAFRDPTSGNKESDMIYLPIIVLDKKSGKSRPEKSTQEPIYQPNKENFQIYAANLQEQQNIFQNFGDLSNILSSEEPNSRKQEYSPQQNVGIEATSGMRYADSLLGTIIDEAVEPDFINESERIPFRTGKSPFTYQVGVDISPSEHTGSLKEKDKKPSQVRNSSVNNPLHDGYPVTKDYIKVSNSEQKRTSLIAPLKRNMENKPVLVMGQEISEEKKPNRTKEEAQNSSSIKLIDDQTISMSIAQSKASPPTKSIMRNTSQEQILEKGKHIGPSEIGGTKGKSIVTKMSVVKEKTSQDLKRKSMKTGTPQRQSVARSSKVAGSGFVENTSGAETRHHIYNEKKSLKPEMHNEQNADRKSKVQTSPQSGQGRKSTVAKMADPQSPSLQNIRASHAQSRKSAVENGSKLETNLWTPPSPVYDYRKSVLNSQADQNRKSTVAHMTETSPSLQNVRASQAQSRKSAVPVRPSTANLYRNDGRKSMKDPAPDGPQKAVPASQGKKSIVPSSAHNTHIVAGKTDKFPDDKEDDSEEALRQFTKDVFQVDLGPQGQRPSQKSEQKKPSVVKGNLRASAVGPAESGHQLRKSAVGQQPVNTHGQAQHVPGSVEPSHEQIGDNSAGIGKASLAEESKRKPRSLMKTTSKLFTTLSKIGKKKSDQANPYIPTGSPKESRKSEGKANPATTQDNDGSNFVRSIEPTVTQYKKTQTLTKSKSKQDTKVPKEKKSLTKLFSRSKSKTSNESGDENMKKKKSKGKGLLGILKRSKSSELSPAAGEESAHNDKQAVECECFAHYIQSARICAYFFLGTTLNEQIMNIIKIFLSGN